MSSVNANDQVVEEQQVVGQESQVRKNKLPEFVITPEDLEILKLAKGYSDVWNEVTSTSDIADQLIQNSSARDISLALLCVAEQFNPNFPADVPLCAKLARSSYIQLARAVLNTNHDITSRYHRIIVDKDKFNPRVNLGKQERETPLSDASVWTLCKQLDSQVRFAVETCYPRQLHGLPIFAEDPRVANKTAGKKSVEKSAGKSADSKTSNKTSDKTSEKTTEKKVDQSASNAVNKPSVFDESSRREIPTFRLPIDASYRGKTDITLIETIDTLRIAYNKILKSNPDFSDAYRAANAVNSVDRPQRPQRLQRQQGQSQGQRQEKPQRPQRQQEIGRAHV